MKTLTRGCLAALCLALVWFSCGGSSVSGEVGAAGGEVCLPDRKVCIEVPLGGLETQELVRISPGGEKPEAALSESYEIVAASGKPIAFLKPAKVTMSLDLVDAATLESLPNENLLRVYSKQDDAWYSLGNPNVDRVTRRVSGTTTHLSPFVLLRADRLPDGGIPEQLDAGPYDGGGTIVVPPFDAGRPDAGMPDAGRPDAGMPDAGMPDAGQPDAGMPDAGTPDAGQPDAGPVDAGHDAGMPDAGPVDSGVPDAGFDAGVPDAGQPDAGAPDAGEVDAGEPDAGDAG
ncbi:MAG: hypothetical protein ACO1OB_07685 [Archangium sp.]